MTRFAQSDTKLRIKEAVLGAFAFNKLIPQFSEWKLVMMGVKVNLPAFLAVCSTMLAGVVISFVYASTPFDVKFGVAQESLLLGLTALVVGSLCASACLGPLNVGNQVLSRSHIMEWQVFGNAERATVHVGFNDDVLPAAALTFVLALISLHPFVNALVVGFAVVTGVRPVLNVPSHIVQSLYQIQRSAASKQGELLETPPSHVEGNQQPSYRYTCGRFRDYRSSEVCLITG